MLTTRMRFDCRGPDPADTVDIDRLLEPSPTDRVRFIGKLSDVNRAPSPFCRIPVKKEIDHFILTREHFLHLTQHVSRT